MESRPPRAPRKTFDRLVGPLRLETRDEQPVLVPGAVADWRIERAIGEKDLYVRVAALAEEADDARIAQEASALGMRGRIARVDLPPRSAPFFPAPPTARPRAQQLLADLRAELAKLAPPSAAPKHPLITFPPGEDPRPLWRMSESLIKFMESDDADRIVDCVRWSFSELVRDRARYRFVRDLAAPIAEDWRPHQGATALFASVRGRIGVSGDQVLWPYVLALVLVEWPETQSDLRWCTLCTLTPLLVAAAQELGGRPPHDLAYLGHDSLYAWRTFAREARSWKTTLVEMRKAGPRRRWGGEKVLGAAISELAGALLFLGDIRATLDIDASDGLTLWRRMQDSSADRLAYAGVTRATATGSLLGLEVRALLSIGEALNAKVSRCKTCETEFFGGGWYCEGCRRERWREQKSPAHGRSATAAPEQAASRGHADL